MGYEPKIVKRKEVSPAQERILIQAAKDAGCDKATVTTIGWVYCAFKEPVTAYEVKEKFLAQMPYYEWAEETSRTVLFIPKK